MAARLLALLAMAAATSSAGERPGTNPDDVSVAAFTDARGDLLEEIAVAMNSTEAAAFLRAAKVELPNIQVQLASILAALPRASNGLLGPPAVRYALHHYFVRNLGWRLKGLDPLGEQWNSSSPSTVAALERMPEAVRAVIKARLDGQGFDESDTAVLAATLKYLIESESVDRLKAAYGVLGFELDEPVAEAKAMLAMQMSMAIFISGRDIRTMPRRKAIQVFASIDKLYPNWNVTVDFLIKEFASERNKTSSRGQLMAWADAAQMTRVLGERYGPWQDKECRSLKTVLVGSEIPGTGRLRLADFYRASLNGKWEFSESVDYLRQLGALDEAVPSDPTVIIANYVDSYSNCLAASPYNDLCCIGECEALTASLERALASPTASPAALVAAIAALPALGGGVGVPDAIAAVQRQRLNAIASRNGGVVPIYGRLFAQWMHYQFPRECVYPHVAGTTKPVDIFDFSMSEKVNITAGMLATKTDMQSIAARKHRKGGPVHAALWVNKEELLAPPEWHSRPIGFAALQFVVALAALTVAVMGLCSTACDAARLLRRSAQKARGRAPTRKQARERFMI